MSAPVAETSATDAMPADSDPPFRLVQARVEGAIYLLALPDLVTARRRDPLATFVGIPRDEALEMALSESELAGILFTTTIGRDAWAAISRDDMSDLLKK